MLLPQQIQAILYHLMMGWFYGCTFSFLCSLSVYIRFKFLKGLIETLYHITFILLSFYGLYYINGGVTNPYLIAFFLLGIFIYYTLYLPVFMQGFAWFINLFYPIKYQMKKCKNTYKKQRNKRNIEKKKKKIEIEEKRKERKQRKEKQEIHHK